MSARPFRPSPEVHSGTPAHRLIRGVMRMTLAEPHVARVLLHRAESWAMWLVDSGDGDAEAWSTRGDTTIHVLWQADEDDAWVEVAGTRYPIAPGDTMSVPGGASIRLAAGMLVVQIEADARSLEHVFLPSHGEETFEGYNRRSDYQTPGAFSLQRWKITQPLSLPPYAADFVVVDLAAPLAMTWAGGADLIGRGECRVVQSGLGPITLLPDGLGYALVVR